MSEYEEKGSIRGVDLLSDETVLEPRQPKPRPAEDLLTVVETIFHVSNEGGTTTVKNGFERRLKTKEQVYRRINAVAKQEWKLLDFSWLNEDSFNVGHVAVKNEDQKPSVNPTKEEKERMDAKVLELAFSYTDVEPGISCGDIIIPVGESCRFTPGHGAIYIRCSSGEGKYTLTAVPK